MADLTELVATLERRVQPNDDFYKFSAEELEREILEAIKILNPEYTVETLPVEKEHLVLWKAMSSCYYTLAAKHADSIRVKIESDEYHANTIPTNYFRLGQKYENMFTEHRGIDVTTVTRRQTGTGRFAPYEYGDKP